MRYKKELGQHFLIDRNIAAKIARAGDVQADEHIWEIGPGKGILTRELLELSPQLLAFEIDEELYPHLEKEFGDKLQLIRQDVLKADWNQLFPDTPVKIIANIPYQITSPLLMKIINYGQKVSKVVIMIQKEVSERLRAQPNCKDYSFLSIKTQFYFDVKYEFTVKPHLFFPRPKVDSAVVSLLPKKELPHLEDSKVFWQLVDTCFRSRRKTLRNNLKYFTAKENVPQIEKITGIDLTRRAETLSIPEFLQLYQGVRSLLE